MEYIFVATMKKIEPMLLNTKCFSNIYYTLIEKKIYFVRKPHGALHWKWKLKFKLNFYLFIYYHRQDCMHVWSAHCTENSICTFTSIARQNIIITFLYLYQNVSFIFENLISCVSLFILNIALRNYHRKLFCCFFRSFATVWVFFWYAVLVFKPFKISILNSAYYLKGNIFSRHILYQE